MNVIVYGIANCDSCRKATKWLKERNISYRFVNFKETKPDASDVGRWLTQVGAAKLLNKRSTTWKQLDAEEKTQADTQLIELLQSHPNLIKRPVLETATTIDVGFKTEQYAQIFNEE